MQNSIDISSIEIKDFKQVKDIANQVSRQLGIKYLPIDRGEERDPQYLIVRAFAVGDPVRAACMGKAKEEGIIVAISDDFSEIKTSTSEVFVRYKDTLGWQNEKGWSLIMGSSEQYEDPED